MFITVKSIGGTGMIKERRHRMILQLLDEKNAVKVSDLVETLNVTDMTIRRDLQELEDENLLIRTHGGARKTENQTLPFLELSHQTKREINPDEKNEIAQLIASNIHDNETVFLGSGSTIELVYDYLALNHAKIITNSIYVFDKFKYDERYELILTGGAYRSKTGSFTGTIANDFISTINVEKSFIGVNALNEYSLYNANEDEGVIQRSILKNSRKKYVIADFEKFDKMDFYQFYDLRDIDYLITDSKVPQETKDKYSKWVQIIN